MSNDTPPGGADDSHAPFMVERNEPDGEGVATGMDQQQNIPNESPGTVTPTGLGVDLAPSDTGEMEPVPATTDAIPPMSGTFDYDDYYASQPPWPPDQTTPPVVTKPARNRDGIMFFVGALAAAFLGAALTVGLLAATGTLSAEQATPSPTTTLQAAVVEQATATDPQITNTIINDLGAAVNPSAVAVKTIPSIVTITTIDAEGAGFGSGSGVVISADGYIATNEHVVSGASEYQITFEDGRVYEAILIGSDPLTDLAVLQISADGLVPVEFGSADALGLGDPAVAVGNPLGQQGGSSISVGIVSAFNRQVDFSDGSSLFGMIQTDAAINSGSSGGALVDVDGKLIGITSAIGVSTAGPEGIGYAIPVELVDRITSEIIESGDVAHPFLGVTIGTYIEQLDDGAQFPAGAEVITIEGTDSAAGAAGLAAGDIIVRIGKKDISSQSDLILAVRLYRVGDVVEFVALRDGEEVTVAVVMGQRPSEFGG